jgi:hypothetical protein
MLEYKGYKVAGGSIKRERRTKNKKFPPRRTTKQDRATEKRRRNDMQCSKGGTHPKRGRGLCIGSGEPFGDNFKGSVQVTF